MKHSSKQGLAVWPKQKDKSGVGESIRLRHQPMPTHNLALNDAVVRRARGSVIPANARPMASSLRVMHRTEFLCNGGSNAGKSVQLGQGAI